MALKPTQHQIRRVTGALPLGHIDDHSLNSLSAELNPICLSLALLGAHPILHISRIRVKCQF